MDELSKRRKQKQIANEFPNNEDINGFINVIKYLHEYGYSHDVSIFTGDNILFFDSNNDDDENNYSLNDNVVVDESCKQLISLPFFWNGYQQEVEDSDRDIEDVIEDIKIILKMLTQQ